jgi:release factor glutamine methyltransferase
MKDIIRESQERQRSNPALEWTILRLLNWSISYFKRHQVEDPRASAEILLSHILNLNRIELYIRYDQPVIPSELKGFKALVRRRIQGEPVAYIIGVKGFWSSDFKVTRDVLIPRPETEHMVEAALKIASTLISENPKNRLKILDLGTGSGAIIISLAKKIQNALFFASDNSISALKIALSNAENHNLREKILFFSGDWLFPIHPERIKFDLILSNPPYIPSSEIEILQPEIRGFEPRSALDGGSDGLDAIRHLIQEGHAYLSGQGTFLLEIGDGQKQSVEAIAQQTERYGDVYFLKDLGGADRVACLGKLNGHNVKKYLHNINNFVK